MSAESDLLAAAVSGDVSAVKSLLGAGVAVDARDDWLYTPLMRACKEGHDAVVHVLLDAQADVNAQNDWHQTSLMFAALYGHKEIVRALLQAGAEPAAVSKLGRTATGLAALAGHDEVHQILIAAGGIDTGNGSGPSPTKVRHSMPAFDSDKVSEKLGSPSRNLFSPDARQNLSNLSENDSSTLSNSPASTSLRRRNQELVTENATLRLKLETAERELKEERNNSSSLESRLIASEKKVAQLETELRAALLHGGYAL